MNQRTQTPAHPIPGGRTWSAAQLLVWLTGLALLAALVFAPTAGLHGLWNVLIPLAPAILVFMPGVWRNICPLGSTALAPRRTGRSLRRRLSDRSQGRLVLGGVLLLLLIVPLRHVALNLSGPASAVALVVVALMALVAGLSYEWKSAWCSGLCPVHPVERLYGQEPAVTAPNMHCRTCEGCVSLCPDSVKASPLKGGRRTGAQQVACTLMTGGFPGFVWGWFQVRDYAGAQGWSHLADCYTLPMVGLAATLVLYLGLRPLVGPRRHAQLARVFAFAAVACYYWYRLPALFGYGPFPGDGMLVDLRQVLPAWAPFASHFATTALFGWWLLAKPRSKRSWLVRPSFARDAVHAPGMDG
jgi:hypothetical protein